MSPKKYKQPVLPSLNVTYQDGDIHQVTLDKNIRTLQGGAGPGGGGGGKSQRVRRVNLDSHTYAV